MAEVVPTIKVKPWGKDHGEYVVINEADFDEKVHKKLTDAELAKIEKAEAEAEAPAADGEAE